MLINIFLLSVFCLVKSNGLQCSLPNNNYRLDCFPEAVANQNDCIARGCCWLPPENKRFIEDSPSIPYCFFPIDYPNYQIKSFTSTNRGIKSTLIKQQKSFLPKEILNLNFEIIYETNYRLRIRITDPKSPRYEVPIELGSADPSPPLNPEYQVIMPRNGSLSFLIKRKSDGLNLFKLIGPLLYSDQFIQISTFMSTDHVYGIGEQNRPFLHDLSSQWERIGLWARDFPVDTYMNLYGTHPFYMGMPDSGKAFGVFYFNSNAQEFVLQPTPAITYRTTGGILDIFIFTGGTPERTVKQFHELIGKPMLPPFWALGFQLSKYGYKNIAEISNTLLRNINVGIPIDVQWSDIDYMDKYKDFTVDPINYKGFGSFVKDLQTNHGIKYVTIIDPGISIQNTGSYSSYDELLEMNAYVKDSNTMKPLIGKVWPGETIFPDFTHPNITKYWFKQIQRFYSSVPIDGLWIDMNEPSNFYDGSKTGCPGSSPYDQPFFIPAIRDNSLIKSTICSSSLHYNNTIHYNLHNFYGYTEAVATYQALLKLRPNKRPFVLSRSTFSGSGKYTFHWTGDNSANWDQLAHSIRQILNFNMFGIPMTGADICGFLGDSNEELCIRWMQLGSFYPFMRNHNTLGARDQDPASWSTKAQRIMQRILTVRYDLLPYFYTQLVKSHLYGGTVMRPLSFEFYDDPVTHSIDLQFMIGPSILVSPVVKQGATSVAAYFPSGIWYNMWGMNLTSSSKTGQWINLDAPLDRINVAIRGGQIITIISPRMNTNLTRNGPFQFWCTFSSNRTASGDLYWDDGESLDSYLVNKYSYFTFTANESGFISTPKIIGYNSVPILDSLLVFGLNYNVTSITVNGKSTKFMINSEFDLYIYMNNMTLLSPFIVEWK